MDMRLAFNGFLVIGAVFIAAALAAMVFMIYKYIKGMRSQGFFGGKKSDETE